MKGLHLLLCLAAANAASAFVVSNAGTCLRSDLNLSACANNKMERREAVQKALNFAGLAATGSWFQPTPASAASFTAGGSLVDRDVGAQVGNPEASASRRADNSNVLFDKDQYFKFGTGAPWIEPGNMEFPKTVPFTPSQQRYDALKKYGSRVRSGVAYIKDLEATIQSNPSSIPDPATAPEYALRPMGLMANSFLASENTGATNELYLARWYVNEIALQLGDAKSASSAAEAAKYYAVAKKATNSYVGLMNRVITSKVGDKFELILDGPVASAEKSATSAE